MAPRNINFLKNKDIYKQNRRKKRARIIVRNLPFQTTENNLKEYFGQYGKIEEVKLLIKADGKPIGCGFIQFDHVQSAAKAIHYANLKPIQGRSIVVDWAIPKHKFNKNTTEDIKDVNNVDINIKKESDDCDNDDKSIIEPIEEINLSNNSIESMDVSDKEDEEDMEDSSEEEKQDVKDEEIIEEFMDEKVNDEDEKITKNTKCISNDVHEGKTVFLKNVPFSVKNEELKKYMEQFGPVYYALICIDSLTEHSKGTAFVKFKNIEDAEKCLSAGTELRLRDAILEAHRALHKNDITNKNNLKRQKEKDSRNLYLIKEGVIIAGSPAAVGVSVTDMAKRLQLERWKSQILRNLNMFVSRVRLVVQNLPASLDDVKLRLIFKKYGGSKAIIKEARIMRDLKNIDSKGVGKSKEYGFVTFTKHEDALKALRAINNNPNIFTPHKRPIVAFSIENRIMVNAKQRRIQKSQARNPLYSGNKDQGQNKYINKVHPMEETKVVAKNELANDKKSFSGIKSKPGETKIRSKFNLKNQSILHSKVIKKEKNAVKHDHSRKTKLERAKKELKTKQIAKRGNVEDANFNKLVNSYKSKLLALGPTRSKWYDTT
ncbi:RNA-binding protein 28-like [Vespa velutina]|uniref:RNA-binding protein 28-like n=1 Tax=Vespa velutina TaxID=202808 RepID=UPI001FB22DC1|nr:RNA-binding protein 28-like [Vespa velutina]XP_047369617.1 RNA-binding protein 28-like [Vespa velutina]